MKNFKHVSSRTVEDAVLILETFGKKARVIAGGTDLLGELQDTIRPDYPEVLVNIKTIAGLDYIEPGPQSLKIGALTRLNDIAADSSVKKDYPLLAEAARKTASPHIREMGSIGGNISQNNRCWYYWVPGNRFNCMRKGGRVCYALLGDGRYHSIFGATRVGITPCSADCPAHVDIPSYMSKIREGDIAGAAEILLHSNPIPAVTGRVCPHFCEPDCNRGSYQSPVSIRSVERFLGDFVLDHSSEFMKSPNRESTKRICVIGSGPAGLSAAFYLRQLGHRVVVLEALEKAGGMLRYGIPPYRLPKDILDKIVSALQDMGVQFKTGTRVGTDITVSEITKGYDAVFFACGAWKERDSEIGGDSLLCSGTEYLKQASSGAGKVKGKKAAIIGGGNVAVDVARTLLRQGSEPVIVYRRSRTEMPAIEEEVKRLEEEGIEIKFLTIPVSALEKGKGIALTCKKMKLGPADESGRPRPVPIGGSDFVMEFDLVYKAIGEIPDLSLLPAEFVEKSGRSSLKINGYHLGGKAFAGGDFATGPATVVAALAAGRGAAATIDRFLGGAGLQSDIEIRGNGRAPLHFSRQYAQKTGRYECAELPVEERLKSVVQEDVRGLELHAVKTEAERCFNCGCLAVNPSDTAPALIALDASIRTTKRVIAAEAFFAVRGDNTTILEDDEIVTAIEVPKPKANTGTKFIKFALRKSIDFPIVNCAAALEIKNGTVKAARICLNAVYNNPYRAVSAEEYIVGKAVNKENAEKAAATILKDTLPLMNNAYKVQVAKTLIKRAILGCATAR